MIWDSACQGCKPLETATAAKSELPPAWKIVASSTNFLHTTECPCLAPQGAPGEKAGNVRLHTAPPVPASAPRGSSGTPPSEAFIALAKSFTRLCASTWQRGPHCFCKPGLPALALLSTPEDTPKGANLG